MPSTWDPWRELRHRSHIIFEFDSVAKLGGGAIYARRGTMAAIVIDPDLPRRDRRAALAHELVHDERGGIVDHTHSPATWAAVVQREERRVDDVAASRLVPLDQLDAWARRRVSAGPIYAIDVADEFDVPSRVALVAIRLLRERGPARTAVGASVRS